jgi:hypothetical protein
LTHSILERSSRWPLQRMSVHGMALCISYSRPPRDRYLGTFLLWLQLLALLLPGHRCHIPRKGRGYQEVLRRIPDYAEAIKSSRLCKLGRQEPKLHKEFYHRSRLIYFMKSL